MKKSADLIIIGGGIMGLMTSYYASQAGLKVILIEKLEIGNQKAASFSKTRSFRLDYIDPLYASLANQARILWKELERESGETLLYPSKLLNLVRKDVTPNIKDTYAYKSYLTLKKLGFPTKRLSKKELKENYPQFEVDFGFLDESAGVLYIPSITKFLLKALRKQGVRILENTVVWTVREQDEAVKVATSKGTFTSKKLSISSGLWTNQVIRLIRGCNLQFPITPDKPSECKYFILPKDQLDLFTSERLPILPYLDVGIYGHPIILGKTSGVKISYYNPPDIKKMVDTKIQSVQDFVEICMPSLKKAKMVDVADADQCSYDMVADKNFIIGKLPGFKNILIATGWNGTGYKFSPVIGKIITGLASCGKSPYNIQRFNPVRFTDKAKVVKIVK